MISARTKWTGIDKETRQYILERDKHCIICGKTNFLTIAHIFVNRSHGGKGCKENLVCLCADCHYNILDNPLGEKYNKLSKKYLEYCKNYLINKENIEINEHFLANLIFSRPLK